MGQQKKRPIMLDTVDENYAGPPISCTRQRSTPYKPHKYGSPLKLEPQCKCLSAFSFLVKLRDRYIKAMNEMAIGGDFTAVTGYHGLAGYDYTVQHCKSVKDRQMDALQEELAASRTIQEPSAAVLRSKPVSA